MNFTLGTREDYASVGVIITTERDFTIDTPSGPQEVFMAHFEQNPDTLVDMIRKAPKIEFLKEDEMRLFVEVNSPETE